MAIVQWSSRPGFAPPSTYRADCAPQLGSTWFQSVSDAPGASLTYASGAVPFTSTCDALALSTSVTWDVGARARAISDGRKMPMLLLPWTYSGLIPDDDACFRAASKGFAVLRTNVRGHGGAGNPDDGCRETQDYADCLPAVAAAHPTWVDGTRAHVIGYSGGGGVATMMLAKYPGLFVTTSVCFGWADYGCNVAAGHSLWGAGGFDATLIARIGPRATIGAYRARQVLRSLAYSARQSTARSFFYWDAADPIGICLRDVRAALLDPAVPLDRWQSEESQTDSFPRWEHGLPNTVPALVQLENVVYQRRDELAPTVAKVGEYPVSGHLVHGSGFSLWTAAAGVADPRADAAGGQRHQVHVSFNQPTGLFYVTPLSGTCSVQIFWNGTSKVADVSAPCTLFDLAN